MLRGVIHAFARAKRYLVVPPLVLDVPTKHVLAAAVSRPRAVRMLQHLRFFLVPDLRRTYEVYGLGPKPAEPRVGQSP